MATADGRGRDGLSRQLLDAPHRFDFYQAVRILEARRRERQGPGPNRPVDPGPDSQGVGHDSAPGDEVVRFRAQSSLGFPAATIAEIREPAAAATPGLARPLEMIVTFLGLIGPSGVLPRHYTELVLERLREKDSSLRDFLDLFHHRLISLLYRAWEKYRWPVAYERARLDYPPDEHDLATGALASLVGMGTRGLRRRLDISDEVFLFYSGHFAHFPRSAIALESLLTEYLEMPTRVLQCQGQWLLIDPEDRSLMPSAGRPRGQNNLLGVNLILGERVWDVQSKFRLRIGPLTWAQFRSLMPDSPGLLQVGQLTRSFVGLSPDFDVQPLLKPEEVPPCRLGLDAEPGSRLGWNCWLPLRRDPPPPPLDDAVFQIPEPRGKGQS